MNHYIAFTLLALIVVLIKFALGTALIYLSWNYIVLSLFDVKAISFYLSAVVYAIIVLIRKVI